MRNRSGNGIKKGRARSVTGQTGLPETLGPAVDEYAKATDGIGIRKGSRADEAAAEDEGSCSKWGADALDDGSRSATKALTATQLKNVQQKRKRH